MERKDYNAILKRANKRNYDAFMLKAPIGKVCVQPEFDVNGLLSQLEDYDAAHSVKTYQQDFFEKFPNAARGSLGDPRVCSRNVYGESVGSCPRAGCVACWNRPMPDKVD